MKKIRVAQILGHAANGGVENYVMNYYKNIDHNRIEFDFFIDGESLVINKNKVLMFGNARIFITPKESHIFKYMFYLYKIFKINHFDIVHANLNSLCFLALIPAKLAGIKVRIAHSHSMANKKEGILRYFLKNILKMFSHLCANVFFACSKDAGEWLFGKRILCKNNFFIIKNAIDLEVFSFNLNKRKEVRLNLGISEDTFVMGFVGRLVQQKNPLFLLDVFVQFKQIYKKSCLIFVGEGNLRNELETKVINLGLKNDVYFVGSKSNTDYYYSAFDFLLFPSFYEGLGITLIEAQVSGLHSICSEFIPSEAIICNNVKKMSLDEGAEFWSNSINPTNKYDRKTELNEFVAKGFDIHDQANRLCSIYLKLSGK